MAGKTPTELFELIKELEKQWELLRAEVSGHDRAIDASDIPEREP